MYQEETAYYIDLIEHAFQFISNFFHTYQSYAFINILILGLNMTLLWVVNYSIHKRKAERHECLMKIKRKQKGLHKSKYSLRSSGCLSNQVRREFQKPVSPLRNKLQTRTKNLQGKTIAKMLCGRGGYVTSSRVVAPSPKKLSPISEDYDETLDEITWAYDDSASPIVKRDGVKRIERFIKNSPEKLIGSNLKRRKLCLHKQNRKSELCLLKDEKVFNKIPMKDNFDRQEKKVFTKIPMKDNFDRQEKKVFNKILMKDNFDKQEKKTCNTTSPKCNLSQKEKHLIIPASDLSHKEKHLTIPTSDLSQKEKSLNILASENVNRRRQYSLKKKIDKVKIKLSSPIKDSNRPSLSKKLENLFIDEPLKCTCSQKESGKKNLELEKISDDVLRPLNKSCRTKKLSKKRGQIASLGAVEKSLPPCEPTNYSGDESVSSNDQHKTYDMMDKPVLGNHSESSIVCKRDSWIWFSPETRPSMENFASRQRKFKSQDPRVAALVAEIRRQEELNRDIERTAESLIDSSSPSTGKLQGVAMGTLCRSAWQGGKFGINRNRACRNPKVMQRRRAYTLNPSDSLITPGNRNDFGSPVKSRHATTNSLSYSSKIKDMKTLPDKKHRKLFGMKKLVEEEGDKAFGATTHLGKRASDILSVKTPNLRLENTQVKTSVDSESDEASTIKLPLDEDFETPFLTYSSVPDHQTVRKPSTESFNEQPEFTSGCAYLSNHLKQPDQVAGSSAQNVLSQPFSYYDLNGKVLKLSPSAVESLASISNTQYLLTCLEAQLLRSINAMKNQDQIQSGTSEETCKNAGMTTNTQSSYSAQSDLLCSLLHPHMEKERVFWSPTWLTSEKAVIPEQVDSAERSGSLFSNEQAVAPHGKLAPIFLSHSPGKQCSWLQLNSDHQVSQSDPKASQKLSEAVTAERRCSVLALLPQNFEFGSASRVTSEFGSRVSEDLISKEVNSSIQNLLFDTEQSTASHNPSNRTKTICEQKGHLLDYDHQNIYNTNESLMKANNFPAGNLHDSQSNVVGVGLQEGMGEIAYRNTKHVSNQCADMFMLNSTQSKCVDGNQVSLDCSCTKSEKPTKRTNIYTRDYYLGKRASLKKKQEAVTVPPRTSDKSSLSRWKKTYITWSKTISLHLYSPSTKPISPRTWQKQKRNELDVRKLKPCLKVTRSLTEQSHTSSSFSDDIPKCSGKFIRPVASDSFMAEKSGPVESKHCQNSCSPVMAHSSPFASCIGHSEEDNSSSNRKLDTPWCSGSHWAKQDGTNLSLSLHKSEMCSGLSKCKNFDKITTPCKKSLNVPNSFTVASCPRKEITTHKGLAKPVVTISKNNSSSTVPYRSCKPVPSARSDRPTHVPSARSDRPTHVPSARSDRPTHVPSARSDRPSHVPSARSDRPSHVPSARSDRPSHVPSARSDRHTHVPSARSDRPTHVPSARSDRPSHVAQLYFVTQAKVRPEMSCTQNGDSEMLDSSEDSCVGICKSSGVSIKSLTSCYLGKTDMPGIDSDTAPLLNKNNLELQEAKLNTFLTTPTYIFESVDKANDQTGSLNELHLKKSNTISGQTLEASSEHRLLSNKHSQNKCYNRSDIVSHKDTKRTDSDDLVSSKATSVELPEDLKSHPKRQFHHSLPSNEKHDVLLLSSVMVLPPTSSDEEEESSQEEPMQDKECDVTHKTECAELVPSDMSDSGQVYYSHHSITPHGVKNISNPDSGFDESLSDTACFDCAVQPTISDSVPSWHKRLTDKNEHFEKMCQLAFPSPDVSQNSEPAHNSRISSENNLEHNILNAVPLKINDTLWSQKTSISQSMNMHLNTYSASQNVPKIDKGKPPQKQVPLNLTTNRQKKNFRESEKDYIMVRTGIENKAESFSFMDIDKSHETSIIECTSGASASPKEVTKSINSCSPFLPGTSKNKSQEIKFQGAKSSVPTLMSNSPCRSWYPRNTASLNNSFLQAPETGLSPSATDPPNDLAYLEESPLDKDVIQGMPACLSQSKEAVVEIPNTCSTESDIEGLTSLDSLSDLNSQHSRDVSLSSNSSSGASMPLDVFVFGESKLKETSIFTNLKLKEQNSIPRDTVLTKGDSSDMGCQGYHQDIPHVSDVLNRDNFAPSILLPPTSSDEEDCERCGHSNSLESHVASKDAHTTRKIKTSSKRSCPYSDRNWKEPHKWDKSKPVLKMFGTNLEFSESAERQNKDLALESKNKLIIPSRSVAFSELMKRF